MSDDRSTSAKLAEAATLIRSLGPVAVAFSAGVDSSVLLKLCVDELGSASVCAVQAVGPVFPEFLSAIGRQVCQAMGVRLIQTQVDVHTDATFIANPPDRCYHCKKIILDALTRSAASAGFATVVVGENADDRDVLRPGQRALAEANIACPLMSAGLTKREIVALAHGWHLPNWDLPATPCLATRIPFGQAIDAETLARIDAAESAMRARGFRTVRVRDHGGVARIELPESEFSRVIEPATRRAIVEALQSAGYTYATLDLSGFESGSMNKLLANAYANKNNE
jgi:uncharacterized protein